MAPDADPLAAALAAAPDLLDHPDSRTFWLIANSDAVPIDTIRARLAPHRDVLVQYNLCRHAADFADPRLQSLFFFHRSRAGGVHGIAADGFPMVDHTAFSTSSHAVILESAECEGLPALDLRLGMPCVTLPTRPLEALFFRVRPDSTPSAGFASVLFVQLLNLRRALAGLQPHCIALCGFTGRYGGSGFIGHDFHFEQTALATLPNVIHLRDAEPSAAPTRLHHDLAELFGPTYDGRRRGKADMLFDVAKLHLAAGDMPAFVRFTRMSAGISPGHSQIQWLMRTVGAMHGDHAREAAGLDSGTDRMAANWASGRTSELGGIAYPSDFEHPQAAYVREGSGRPRVLVVNETAKLPFNRWHLGCDHVSRALARGLDAHGIDVAGWTNGIAGLGRILARDPEARFDGVVINGEGTLHDDADRAFEIAAIGRHLKELGRPVFLINTVWQGNGAHLDALVRIFDIVAARESASQDALKRARSDARLVPDLCWTAELPASDAAAGPVGILDCVDAGRTQRLEGVAARAGLQMFVMDRFPDAFHRAFADGRPAGQTPRVLLRGDVRAAAGWLGGRFHGVVLALGAGVPVLSTPSNTGKIDAMLADIGLADKLVTPEMLDGLRSRPDVDALFSDGPGAYGPSEWSRVEDYRTRAQAEIDRLFADIAAAL